MRYIILFLLTINFCSAITLNQNQIQVAKKINDPLLIAIAIVESDLNNKVVSNKGAMGLFQIIPKFALKPREARARIKANDIPYMKQLAYHNLTYWYKATGGDKVKALAGYNAGYKYKQGIGYEYAYKVLAIEQEIIKRRDL